MEGSPPEILQGGSAPAETLLNLIGVTILANLETLDFANSLFYSQIIHKS